MDNYLEMLKNSFLCKGLNDEEFQYFIAQSNIQLKKYRKNEFIFMELEKPEKLFLLVDGCISVYKDTMSGKVMPIADIEESGDVFGEIYLYMQKDFYEVNALAKRESTILVIQSQIFQINDDDVPIAYYKIARNLLTTFARKAYLLTTKIQVLGSGSLRQRIARYILNCERENGVVKLTLTREKMAEYLNTTRPSLSRELSNMHKERLIEINGKTMKILDEEALDDCL
mgnify:CR=1 FL=1